jgi:hypothetical protein
VVLPVTALSVVPVASKNTSSGEIPASRTIFARNVSVPLVPVHDAPVGGAGGGVLVETVTVADWLALPPVPVQVNTY